MFQGELDVVNNQLIFRPLVYPSTVVKQVGFSWDGVRKCWRGPKVVAAAQFVLRKFPQVAVTVTAQALLEESEPALPEPVLPESAIENLFSHQKEALKILLQQASGGGALLALAPRLGKAVVSIRAAIAADKQHILVVCPLSLLHNWRCKIAEWGNQDQESIAICRGKIPTPVTRWTITNYDTIRTKGIASGFDLIILDESVLLKNRKAQRTRACRAAVQTTRKANSRAAVWELSGSPKTKFYDDLWSQLNILDPRRFSSYWRFAREYTTLETTVWGTSIAGNQIDAEERLKKDLVGIFFSVNQQDISNTEPFFFENLEILMDSRQQRMYQTMEDDFFAQLSELEDGAVLASNVLTQLLRLIQIASNPALVGGPNVSPKMDAVVEMLEYTDLPIVVWTNFIATAQQLHDCLVAGKHNVALLTGATPEAQRQIICDNFQTGKLDVLVAHPRVGKFGLELFAAKAAVYLERSYDSDDFYQSLHRIRLADSPTSHIINLLSVREDPQKQHTVDHIIDRILKGRYGSTQRLTARDLRCGE